MKRPDDTKKLRKHLTNHLGTPTELYRMSKNPQKGSAISDLTIAYFAPGGPSSRVVFATVGAYRHRMSDGRRMEALTILRKEPTGAAFEAVRALLSSIVLVPEAYHRTLRHGDILRAREYLAGFSSMDAVLLMPPMPFTAPFHRAPLSQSGEAVDWMWLIPIYEAEGQYALDHGYQALMVLFAAQGLDLTDPNRPQADVAIDPVDAVELAKGATGKRIEAARAARRRARPDQPKTAPRNVGKGSFEVTIDQKASAVRITRRRK